MNLRYCSYDALGENGIPIKGKFVNSGDAIFGKVAPVQNLKKVKTVQLFDKDYVENNRIAVRFKCEAVQTKKEVIPPPKPKIAT